MKQIVHIVVALGALTVLSACASTNWDKVYSGMTNNGVFRH